MSTAIHATPEEQLAVILKIGADSKVLQHIPGSQTPLELSEIRNNPYSIFGSIEAPLAKGSRCFTLSVVNTPREQVRGSCTLVMSTEGTWGLWVRLELEGIDSAFKHSFYSLSKGQLQLLLQTNPGLGASILGKLDELIKQGKTALREASDRLERADADIASVRQPSLGSPPIAA